MRVRVDIPRNHLEMFHEDQLDDLLYAVTDLVKNTNFEDEPKAFTIELGSIPNKILCQRVAPDVTESVHQTVQ